LRPRIREWMKLGFFFAVGFGTGERYGLSDASRNGVWAGVTRATSVVGGGDFSFAGGSDVAGAEIKSLADRLAELTVKQAGDLASYLKEAYRIEAPAAAVSQVRTHTIPSHAVEVPSTVDVMLKSAGDKKIQVIRVVRQYTSL